MKPPTLETDALLATLAQLDAAVMSDVLDEFGFPNQVLSRTIGPVTRHQRLCGRAGCAALRRKIVDGAGSDPYDDFSSIDQLAVPGIVIVFACGPAGAGAVLGEFMTREFRRRGAGGVLTDGAIRDLTVIDALDFPIHATGVSPLNGARRLAIESTGKPVTLPGESGNPVTLAPGDYILGDRDGVLVIPQDIAQAAIAAALTYAAAEKQIGNAMTNGATRNESLGKYPRNARIGEFWPPANR